MGTRTETLRAVELQGREYLEAATALLLAARGDDPLAGPLEAGEIQWRWAATEPAASRGTFWFDSGDVPVAAVLVAKEPGGSAAGGAVLDCELAWRPALDADVRAAAIAARIGAMPGQRVRVLVDEGETGLRRLLEEEGFRHDPEDDFVQLWQRPGAAPASAALPDGFRFDDRSCPADQPHHFAKRNGPRVADRLRETSLYRPDLDLCVRTDDGEVAAYGLCWLDPANRAGVFEPVRTEDAFKRRGLGRALLTEGIRRMLEAGADLIKVTCERGNPAALGLYDGVGFGNGIPILAYVRP